jgi:hypothetical protein
MTYRERREARAEQLREWADRREAKQPALDQAARADEATTGIPFGQPILVGHHSEGRHRAAIARMDRAMSAAVENGRKAESMAGRADEIEAQAAAAIYSDDTDAVDRLREKLERLEAERDRIKTYNATCRKRAKIGLDNLSDADKEQWNADILAAGLTKSEVRDLFSSIRAVSYQCPGGRFPAYKLTNLGGVISTTRKRLAELEKPERGRWLEARYPGECRSCGETIGKGDRALYFKRSRELECQPCGLGDGGTGA